VRRTAFNAVQLKELRTKFYAKKKKKNGELDKLEFKEVFESFHWTNADVDKVFEVMDSDGSGTISFEELAIYMSCYRLGVEDERLDLLFRIYDTDDSGALAGDEIANVGKALFKSFSRFEHKKSASAYRKIEDLLAHLDKDKDGKITLEEWVTEGLKVELVKSLLGPDYIE